MNLKTTVPYRSPDDIYNLKIRIKIKIQSPEGTNLKEEMKVFAWQQKYFSKIEVEFYKEKSNCLTSLENKYHEDVVHLIHNDEILFSYIHEDQYEFDEGNNIQHAKTTTPDQGDSSTKNFNYEEYLIKAMGDAYLRENYHAMHLMADLGEYHNNKWLKNEQVLCTVKYNKDRNYLLIYPDFTSDMPYIIKTATNNYIYYVEDVSDKMPIDLLLKETEILNKISSQRDKLKMHGMDNAFVITPSESVLNVYLFIEILHGKDFENNGIYVGYHINLPRDYSTQSKLHGTTATSYSSNHMHHFSYPFEISLQYNLNNEEEHSPPYIYFEVVSKDFWNCFRIEGLTYTPLPVFKAGSYQYNLQCLRICPDSPLGNLRRYFLGEYPGYSDITWCSIPKNFDKKVLNKYGVNTISTGEITVRINVLHQSQNINRTRQHFVAEKLKMSTLVKSIEQVLEAFKDAKKKMIDARKNV